MAYRRSNMVEVNKHNKLYTLEKKKPKHIKCLSSQIYFTISDQPCANEPCKNEGECSLNEFGDLTCSCRAGYLGSRCEQKGKVV